MELMIAATKPSKSRAAGMFVSRSTIRSIRPSLSSPSALNDDASDMRRRGLGLAPPRAFFTAVGVTTFGPSGTVSKPSIASGATGAMLRVGNAE